MHNACNLEDRDSKIDKWSLIILSLLFLNSKNVRSRPNLLVLVLVEYIGWIWLDCSFVFVQLCIIQLRLLPRETVMRATALPSVLEGTSAPADGTASSRLPTANVTLVHLYPKSLYGVLTNFGICTLYCSSRSVSVSIAMFCLCVEDLTRRCYNLHYWWLSKKDGPFIILLSTFIHNANFSSKLEQPSLSEMKVYQIRLLPMSHFRCFVSTLIVRIYTLRWFNQF